MTTAERQPDPIEDGPLGDQFGLDREFPRRVCRTTALVAGLLAVWLGDRFGWRVSVGLLAGAALGAGGLLAVDWMVRQLGSQMARQSRKLVLLGLLKLPLMGLVVWLVYRFSGGETRVMAALAAGASLVPAVIVLKVLSRTFLSRKEQPAAGRRSRSNG